MFVFGTKTKKGGLAIAFSLCCSFKLKRQEGTQSNEGDVRFGAFLDCCFSGDAQSAHTELACARRAHEHHK